MPATIAGFLMLEGLKECGVKGIERPKNHAELIEQLRQKRIAQGIE